MTSVRLIADDLTGALDTAAEFVEAGSPIPVYWSTPVDGPLPSSAAFDSGTREMNKREAAAALERLAPLLTGSAIAYKKVDSLWRGHPASELSVCFRSGVRRHCIVAPAFPYQGRITRGARQWVRDPEGGWSPVGSDLVAALEAEGLEVLRGRFDQPLPVGISVFDAETEDDLDRVVAIGRKTGEPVLWCGSGGLARALARTSEPTTSNVLRPPVLGLFGSDHPVTARQLAACRNWIRVPDGRSTSAAQVQAHMARAGVALTSFDLPADVDRADAAARIASAIGDLTHRLPPPRTLIVAGGETLRALCVSLKAEALQVTGRVEPGIPRSTMLGGRWSGVDVVSKSGAFGPDHLWRDLLEASDLTSERATP
jgi:D-threonate/D-erythronate kinase